MASSRKYKLVVCAYKPADEKNPVLLIQVQVPPARKFGQYLSNVVRRNDYGYMDLYNACEGKPFWLYDQKPLPLV